MTIGTLSLLAMTGSLVLFKLALMALAVALLANTLLPKVKPVASQPIPAIPPLRSDLAR